MTTPQRQQQQRWPQQREPESFQPLCRTGANPLTDVSIRRISAVLLLFFGNVHTKSSPRGEQYR